MLVVSLALGMGILFTSSAHAFAEPVREDTGSYAHKLSLQQKLNEAIQQRWSLFTKKHVERNTEQKTVPYQYATHVESRKASNTSEVSTMMNRSGALTNYEGTKAYEDYNYVRPNPKQTFKARAIDYYVDGGDAGKEAMRSNVIISSEHKIDTQKYYNTMWKNDFVTIGNIRDVQRAFYTPPMEKSNTQRVRSYNTGSYRRTMSHPFTGTAEVMEEGYGKFFSTEAE